MFQGTIDKYWPCISYYSKLKNNHLFTITEQEIWDQELMIIGSFKKKYINENFMSLHCFYNKNEVQNISKLNIGKLKNATITTPSGQMSWFFI